MTMTNDQLPICSILMGRGARTPTTKEKAQERFIKVKAACEVLVEGLGTGGVRGAHGWNRCRRKCCGHWSAWVWP
jgi:hypothetical protein